MTDYDDPFQMDEEFASQKQSPNESPLPCNPEASEALSEPALHSPVSSKIPLSSIQEKRLRSKLDAFRMEENESPYSEDQAMTFDEDADDKFDKDYAENMGPSRYSSTSDSDEPLTPPENFAPVINQIYRSSFPQATNFAFLRTLKLKSVLCLIPEEYPEKQSDFFESEGIKLYQMGMSGNKEPFVIISSELITEAMKIVLNPANHPILIHCNRGKHRTGCLVGVLRRLQGWSLTIIFDEYRKFAAPKERPMDQQFIELYDPTEIVSYAQQHQSLPLSWD